MDDSKLFGISYEEFLASEEARGAAVRVEDATMAPVLKPGDLVRVEKREADEGDVLCVQVNGRCRFGHRNRSGKLLQPLNGPDVLLKGTEHVVGVVTSIIDRAVRPRRR
jgi:hypothetical protein